MNTHMATVNMTIVNNSIINKIIYSFNKLKIRMIQLTTRFVVNQLLVRPH